MINYIDFIILEALQYGGHDELETDAKLLHMALKHHLRDPENFKKALNNRVKMSYGKNGREKYNHAPIPATSLNLPKDLHDKYKHLTFHIGPAVHNQDLANPGIIHGHYRQTPRLFGLLKGRQHVHLNIANAMSDKNDKMELKDRQKSTLKSLDDSHGVLYHELTHAHQDRLKQKMIVKTDKKGYHNSDHEREAFGNELSYTLKKHILKNNKFRSLMRNHDIMTDDQLTRTMQEKTGAPFHVHSSSLTPDHKKEFVDKIRGHLKKNVKLKSDTDIANEIHGHMDRLSHPKTGSHAFRADIADYYEKPPHEYLKSLDKYVNQKTVPSYSHWYPKMLKRFDESGIVDTKKFKPGNHIDHIVDHMEKPLNNNLSNEFINDHDAERNLQNNKIVGKSKPKSIGKRMAFNLR